MEKSDVLVMAQTVWGEARGETKEGQYAIAHVIKNRLDSKRWFSADTLEGVCKKKWQLLESLYQQEQIKMWKVLQTMMKILFIQSKSI